MDIDQAVFIMGAEFRSQNAHKARQYNQIGLIGIDFFHHGLIKCQTRVEVFMVQTVGGYTALCRPCQSGCGLVVAQYGCNVGIGNIGIHNRLHIAAASGNKDDDIFHHNSLLVWNKGRLKRNFFRRPFIRCLRA